MSSLRLFCLLTLCFLSLGCNSSSSSPGNEESKIAEASKYSLSIDFGNLQKAGIEAEIMTKNQISVIDLLISASQKQGFAIEHRGSGETAFVESIAGVTGGEDGKNWWIYYVNDKLAKQGSGVYQLKPGDRVRWSLGKYEFNGDDESSDQ